VTEIGKIYEKFGQCEGCQVSSAPLFRRTVNAQRVAMGPFLCKSCFTRLEAGLLKKYCPLCTCELRADRNYECGFCRTMGFKAE
jgi:hypothetical protein